MTELIWEGKYDDKGRKVAPPRIALPFQTVETVNESAADRDRNQDLFASGRPTDWRNRLIWGDKKYVLPSLLEEFVGKVNLIYIDPPFATGGDFSFTASVPEDPDEEGDEEGITFVKQPSVIEQKAYRDTWGRGLDGYLKWFSDTVVLLREFLAPEGSLYVHIGSNVSHYVKAVLDEVMGAEKYLNEIVWQRTGAHSDLRQGAQHYGRITDTILFYGRGDNVTFNAQFVPYSTEYVERDYRRVDPDGRRYRIDNIQGPGGAAKGNPFYEVMGVSRYWRFSKERMQELIEQGRIVQTKPGAVPQYKRYLDEMPGMPVQNLWDDLPIINNRSDEALGYQTQKPEVLLERVIKTSSNEGDLVLDCFCGSGTTAAVAEKLNRRWIACDLGRFANLTTLRWARGDAYIGSPCRRLTSQPRRFGYMTKTKSELLFEQLCREHDLRCEPVSRGPKQTPDYDVHFGAQQVVVEVKQVEPTADEAKEIARWEAGEVITFGGEAGKRVRQEITDSKKQLKARAKGRFPALLVLYNKAEPISFLDPMVVLVAMYGALTLPIFTPKDGGTPFDGRLRFGGKRRVTKEHNTTLSAVCVLVLSPQDKPTLTFYHNYFAALSFDPQWFQGERVRHYRLPQAEAESGNYGFWVDLDGKRA